MVVERRSHLVVVETQEVNGERVELTAMSADRRCDLLSSALFEYAIRAEWRR